MFRMRDSICCIHLMSVGPWAPTMKRMFGWAPAMKYGTRAWGGDNLSLIYHCLLEGHREVTEETWGGRLDIDQLLSRGRHFLWVDWGVRHWCSTCPIIRRSWTCVWLRCWLRNTRIDYVLQKSQSLRIPKSLKSISRSLRISKLQNLKISES